MELVVGRKYKYVGIKWKYSSKEPETYTYSTYTHWPFY